MAGSRAREYALWLIETAYAVGIAGLIIWSWPRLLLPRLGQEQYWFGLGWLVALAGPSLLRPLGQYPRGRRDTDTISPGVCAWGSFILAACFLAVLTWGEVLFNYKLWLGIIYLAGVTLRLVGVSLGLRAMVVGRRQRPWVSGLAGAGLAFLACLLAVPWVRPDLAAVWPPESPAYLSPLATAASWGVICGAVLILCQVFFRNKRNAWAAYVALALGVFPSLAVTWFTPAYCAGSAAVLFAAAMLACWRGAPAGQGLQAQYGEVASAYWLLRAMMILWWGAGLAVSLEAAWWQPHVELLFQDANWLRSLGFGAFLVSCLGLLAQYSLPLIGQESLTRLPGRHRAVGIGLTIVALLASLVPLGLDLIQARPRPEHAPPFRLEILKTPVVLGPEHTEVDLHPPTWINGLSRINVISHLSGAAHLPQGTPVAQLIATDDQGVPYIFLLRVGVDTAERQYERRGINRQVAHGKARVAASHTVWAATGEIYQAHDYLTGFYLGRRVGSLADIRLRYILRDQPEDSPVLVTISKLGLE